MDSNHKFYDKKPDGINCVLLPRESRSSSEFRQNVCLAKRKISNYRFFIFIMFLAGLSEAHSSSGRGSQSNLAKAIN